MFSILRSDAVPQPHMEADDHRHEQKRDEHRLRLAAVEAESKAPLTARLDEATRLLLRLRGILAERDQPLDAELDQQLFSWLHAGAVARKVDQ